MFSLFGGPTVFNPHAPSNRHANLQSVYRKHEQIKKRAYEQRIREIEHATFSLLVLSATGGLEGRYLLQDSGLHARLQVGPHLQPHSILATLSSTLSRLLTSNVVSCLSNSFQWFASSEKGRRRCQGQRRSLPPC